MGCSPQKTASTVCQQVWQGKAGSQLILRQEERNKKVNWVKSGTVHGGKKFNTVLRIEPCYYTILYNSKLSQVWESQQLAQCWQGHSDYHNFKTSHVRWKASLIFGHLNNFHNMNLWLFSINYNNPVCNLLVCNYSVKQADYLVRPKFTKF